MATIYDQMANDAAKENALKMLKDDGARLFDLGYNEAKRKAEQEQKARGETTTWDEASEGDKRKYKEDFHCTDELAYWCRKCKKPLSGHWAIVQWWNFCPWCGRKLLSTEEERTTAMRKVWELMQKPEGDNA